MNRQTAHEFLTEALRGELEAVRLVETLGGISQIWDDLVDRDKPVTSEQVSQAFWAALIEVPGNAFYRQHFDTLYPLIRSVILDWETANRLERETPHGQSLAFVLRDSLVGLVVTCAELLGGRKWALRYGPDIRYFFHDETLQDYMGGLRGDT